MALKLLWEHDCPGHIETEVVDGVIRVTCLVEEGTPEPPSGERTTEGLLALYTFAGGSPGTVRDRSKVGKPLDLVLESEAAVSWIPGGGLSLNSSTKIVSADPPTKVIKAIKASNELTLEAWVKPANTEQEGPARIVSLSTDFHHCNTQLSQSQDVYDVRLRTTETTDNGRPSLSTADRSLTADLTHVIYTRDGAGTARIYINGTWAVGKRVDGDLSNWDDSYRLALANELIGSRSWLGEYYLVAIYDRALDETEISQNFEWGHIVPD